MSVDAGTISSSVRLKLDQLDKDIKSAGTAFDNLGDTFTRAANDYSTAGGKQYKAALESISKESKNVEQAVQAGAITQAQGIERLIKLRKEELKILQDKAIKEGTVSSTTVTAIKKVELALSGLEEKQKLLGSTGDGSLLGTFQKMQAVMQGPIAAFMLVKDALGKVVDATKEAIQKSINAQETYSKFSVVFSTIADDAEGASKKFEDAFDLSSESAKKLIGNTGNLLTGFGATQKEALDLSVQVNTLAADLASFTNIEGGADRASAALTKALLGERESAKELGLVIRETDITTALAAKGLSGLTGNALNLAKAQITLEIATSQAKNAIGDYARTHDSAANAQKRSAESTEKLQLAIGQGLSPILTITSNLWTEIATKLADVIQKQNDLQTARKAEKDNNLNLEQRLILLDEEKRKLGLQLNGETILDEFRNKTFSEQGQRIQQAIKDKEEEIKGMQRFQTEVKKGAKTKAEADEAARIAAEKQAELDKIYLDGRNKILKLITKEKTEYELIQEQIDELAALKWSSSKAEEDRLNAIAVLRGQQVAIIEKEAKAENDATAQRAANGDKTRETESKRLASLQGIIDKVNSLGEVEKIGAEKSRESAIKEIEGSTLVGEQKQVLIDQVNQYYDLLESDEASEKFKENLIKAFESVSTLFKSAIESATQATSSFYDSEIESSNDLKKKIESDYDAQVKSIEETYKEKIKLAQKAGDDELVISLETEKQKQLDILETSKVQEIAFQDSIIASKEAEKATSENASKSAESLVSIGLGITKFIASGYTDVASLVSASSELIKLAFAGDEEAALAFTKRLTDITTLLMDDLQPVMSFVVELLGLAMDILTPMLEIVSPFLPLLTDILKVALIPITIQFQILAEILDYISDVLEPVLKGFDKLTNTKIPNLLKGTSIDDDVKNFVKFLGFQRGGIVPTFDTGGIVPGTSRTGDRVPALVNSGEMVLNSSQQSRLFEMLNGAVGNTTNNSSSLNIGTFIGDKAGLRELERQLASVRGLENARRGKV